MAYSEDYGPLAPASDTLLPLPNDHRNGLIAVAVCGMVSFITTSTLFLFLTYKLITWHFGNPKGIDEGHQSPANDLSLGLAQRNFGLSKKAIPQGHGGERQRRQAVGRGPPNQFLVLVYNLFFADMHQATAFMLNIPWIQNHEIAVGVPTCWAQGWFVSTGDLSASCFICAIAIHTYLTVVRGYKPPQWALYLAIIGLWVFIYVMAIAGVAATNNGKGAGGFYVRAAAWCWINVRFESLRLWLHYIWIFLSFVMTSILYSLIFFFLHRKRAFSQPFSHSRPSASTQSDTNNTSTQTNPSGHHPAFLIYPVIYILCTAPLALGRVVSMSGTQVSIAYFCLAGAMIASNGWLDVLLFSTTRHSIIFNAPLDSEDMGLETFAFMRTPHWRRYGNMVWVQGGVHTSNREDGRQSKGRRRAVWGLGRLRESIGWDGRDGRSKNGNSRWVGGPGSGSQESLRGITRAAEAGIQMDTVTTVVVEVEQEHSKTRSREPLAHSIDSSEKVHAQRVGSLRL
ncbi:G protein-coupled glucose receptor regulating Gpa2-domain-containing protein [Daldinia decipiens]|uniref:G protein-coupled glucose receptor regulating Gpa2-domain-containing protein n=1 Tax=Daldinia decipiens TaxID=326647 RepID=UPI0020C53232|nr:G protein-coupled glucose receptor regulating Gpa2-domain-containing protein [Daldinia decipiens]KAI1652416.1 G protein-coupled glucose receptor regulating Gpa2-domain-containing protein [Daldinia decipiens]